MLNSGTDREVVQGGSYNHLEADDVLVNNSGGGGGRDYGVAAAPDTFPVDLAATERLRATRAGRPEPERGDGTGWASTEGA